MNLQAALAFALRHRTAVVVAFLMLATAFWQGSVRAHGQLAMPTRLALVLPDEIEPHDPHVQAWMDAAVEVGVTLELRTASQLLRGGLLQSDVALIVPDTVHRRMNDLLIDHLKALVKGGTRLMLVHDAGISDLTGNYRPNRSRMSELAGVDYALYSELKVQMMRDQVVWADARALPQLRLPPGKLMRENTNSPLISTQPAPQADEELAVVGYHYGRLRYPVFATRGNFDGQRLMHSEGGGLVAGLRTMGRGQVLFVNLPLGYLKLRTDGFFMHSFLRLFAEDVAELPQLSSMPNGQGALVMNWHIDSGAAVPAMKLLTGLRAFDQGPYSVHLTAGPDVDTPGDRRGMDLANNTEMRDWVKQFAARGDEVGSHGGWIHNEFGRVVDVQNRSLSSSMITRNSAAVSDASGRPVREYSAPTGNHPAWVTRWLSDRGVRAYYFTGDVGMAPTRSFQDGHRGPAEMWAFPVLSYGLLASFEEAQTLGVKHADIATWLSDVADFCANNHTVRLVYFHPPGIALFADAFEQWMKHTAELVNAGRLHWMTMTQYADFANHRLQVKWQFLADESRPAAGGVEALLLNAQHPQSLERMTWLLPVARYSQPVVLQGQARVERDRQHWRVVAAQGSTLSLRLDRQLLSAPVAPVAPPAHSAQKVAQK